MRFASFASTIRGRLSIGNAASHDAVRGHVLHITDGFEKLPAGVEAFTDGIQDVNGPW